CALPYGSSYVDCW
nr:immunoglobulin heavy chain junction region [Mus musculus]